MAVHGGQPLLGLLRVELEVLADAEPRRRGLALAEPRVGLRVDAAHADGLGDAAYAQHLGGQP
jgi:hypothetical protein